MRASVLLLGLLAASPAWAGRRGFSVAASDSLSTSYSCEAVTAVAGTDAQSRAVPGEARLSWLHGDLASIVTATTVTWYIALDSGGDNAITEAVTETILDADADAAGTVVSTLDVSYSTSALSTNGSLWVCAKTDAGTATMVSRLFWVVE